jgi:hypothetical protein
MTVSCSTPCTICALASSSGHHAGLPARGPSSVTTVSWRLKAAYRVGRYAICSATMISPEAAARKSAALGSVPLLAANPRVNSDEPASRSASAKLPPGSHSNSP